MSNIPPLPKIEGDTDLLLDVYTHVSLRHAGPTQTNEEYGDTERLAEMGVNALDLAVTQYLYSLKPFLSGSEMQERKDEITSDANYNTWLEAYGLKQKLRTAPDQVHVLNDAVEMRKYFHTYLGAVYIRSGLPTIQHWISALIESTSTSTVNANHAVNAVGDGGNSGGTDGADGTA